MAESDIDAEFKRINDTVNGMRLEFVEMKGEMKATNVAVKGICTSLDGYSKSTEDRLTKVEQDLGNRIPDEPTAFSQLQTHNGFVKRTIANGRAIWAFIGSLVLLGISQLAGLFGKD